MQKQLRRLKVGSDSFLSRQRGRVGRCRSCQTVVTMLLEVNIGMYKMVVLRIGDCL